MKERLNQIKVYLNTFLRLFVNTKGWKVFLFGGVIAFIITIVVGDGMYKYGAPTESGCFAIISACIWVGIFNSIQEICKERDIIKREHRSGMHISSYILARAFYELLICFVQAIIFVVLCRIFLELPEEGLLTNTYIADIGIIFFVVLLSSDYLGLAISSVVKSTTTAMTVMPFVLIVQLVLSGVLFTLESGMEQVAKFTISKWGMEALGAASDVDGLPYNELGWNILPRDAYAFETDHVVEALGIIIAFAALYILISIISLKFVDKDKR